MPTVAHPDFTAPSRMASAMSSCKDVLWILKTSGTLCYSGGSVQHKAQNRRIQMGVHSKNNTFIGLLTSAFGL